MYGKATGKDRAEGPALAARAGTLLPWLLALLLLCACASPSPAGPAWRWFAAWGSAQLIERLTPEAQAALAPEWRPPWRDLTLRQQLRLSHGGEALRVRLSNVHGRTPLIVGDASVALAAAPGSPDVLAPTLRALRFDGRSGVRVEAGAERWSDPVPLPVRVGADLAVTLHIVEDATPPSAHPGSRSRSHARAGNAVPLAQWSGAAARVGWWYLAAVDVATPASLPPPQAVLVATGDSITDGYGVLPDTHQRWTDALARRLAREGRAVAVVNTGIGGNRLLSVGLGPPFVDRFERDVLERTGVTHAVLLIGVNDLGGQRRAGEDSAAARATLLRQMQQAFTRLAASARARGVCLIGATVLPYSNSDYYRPGPDNESDRLALNRWIRDSGTFSAVVDFDAALRDPARPERMRAEYDSGDGLHPSMAGYVAMAESLPLGVLQPCRLSPAPAG